MKRLSSSDTLIPIRPPALSEDGMYGRGFADDDDECGGGGGGEKKRRLSVEQVRALDKNFESENKLDPERKVRLAQELGLQPRQVAVWFQNRRARWKTKQLESDYAALKANYDALRLDFDALRQDNKSLTTQIKQLNGKLAEDSSSVKEELEPVESESEEDPPNLISDSDSSAVLNDNPSPRNHVVTSTTAGRSGCFSWSPFAAPEPKSLVQQLLKQEEYRFLAGDDPCSSALFLDEQPPALGWCGPDQWSWMDAGGENNNKGRREGAY